MTDCKSTPITLVINRKGCLLSAGIPFVIFKYINSFMKEIVYNNIPDFSEIVEENDYKEVHFICVNRGIHPCAYVICDPLFLKKHVTDGGYIAGISVHGGITYTGEINKLKGLDDHTGVCFGWDYGHYNDWAGYWSDEENLMAGQKKWNTADIIYECHKAIDQYLELLEKDAKLDPVQGPMLTKEILKDLGFHSIFENTKGDDESAFQKMGIYEGNKWRIYIDLQSPSLSYARNQSPRRKYEGSILTLDELKMVIDLLDIPEDIDMLVKKSQ